MNKMQKFAAWVQSYIDKDSYGQVTFAPDYIPGNCCLDLPDSSPVKRETDLLGNVLLRRRYSMQIRYFSTLPVDRWLEKLEDWLVCNTDAHVWLQDFRREARPEGTWVHSAKICMEYETDLAKEET